MAPRLLLYGTLSSALFLSVTLSALNSRPNFYSAAVQVGRSSASLMVLWNFGVFGAICLGLGVRRIFFGQLRAIEYEHLFERLWLFLTESLLALTIFRDDFSAGFVMMYGVLVFLKCFHWITADRVDYMDQIPHPGPSTLFHVRIASIITLLATIDLLLVLYSLDSILTYGVSATVLFASEFMILLASVQGTAARYGVNCLDIRRARGREDAPAWEAKSMYMFYIDLAVDFAKLLTYLTFFTVILLNYGIPLHILRDVWMTFRSFISRCSDLIRYRRATRDMDAQYPNATEEDVGRLGDRVCIICREEMVVPGSSTATARPEAEAEAEAQAEPTTEQAAPQEGGPNETPKKLVCGHVFHFHCLRSWLERQQSCPTCRRDVLHTPAPNPRARAAPPAPGAVPQVQARDQFNEFFRLPNENGGMPAPTPVHAPAPPAAPTGEPTHGPTPVSPTQTQAQGQASDPSNSPEDVRIQTSIWGGPIQPGRFFASPLGAIPRSTNPSLAGLTATQPRVTSQVGAGPSASTSRTTTPPTRPVPIRTTPSDDYIRHQPPVSLHPPSSVLPVGRNPLPPPPAGPSSHEAGSGSGSGSAEPTFSGFSPSIPGSEATTPFSSNPPEIFRAMSSEGREGAEVDSRRLAGEAAMRRLGLSSSNRPVAPSQSIKGKEKEMAKDSEATPTPATTYTPTYHTPYLTPVKRAAPHPQEGGAGRPWRMTRSGDGSSASASVREGVDERLRTLKAVDDTIWSLVEELTRMKSLLEVEGEDGQPGSSEIDGDREVNPVNEGGSG